MARPEEPPPSWIARLDRIVAGRAPLPVAFLWGWAEATCFFIVPDVLLTLIACRRLRPALIASVAALAGALLGGAMMVWAGSWAPRSARVFLNGIPGIAQPLILAVQASLEQHGLAAMMLGPLRGVPYKIYAVEWGARAGGIGAFRAGGIGAFLLVSIPARYVRFLLATLAARWIAARFGPPNGRRAGLALVLWALFWTAFYVAYLRRMGW